MQTARLPYGLASFRNVALSQSNGSDPAAAAEFSTTVPTGKAWLVKAVSAELVTDGTGTPWPSLVIDDGTDIIFRGLSGSAAQAVSTTCRHTWAPGLVQGGAASDAGKTGGLPADLVILEGYRIRSLTSSLAGTDNWGAPSFYVVEFSI